MNNRPNFEKSKILQTSIKLAVFLSGISILFWQIRGTFETFIRSRTSFARMEETVESMVPPTLVLCPRHNEFFWLNENLTLTISKFIASAKPGGQINGELKLALGEELMNPIVGLCYAVVPGEKFKLRIEEYLLLLSLIHI